VKVKDAICLLVGSLASVAHLDPEQDVDLVCTLTVKPKNVVEGFSRLAWDYYTSKTSPVIRGTWATVEGITGMLRDECSIEFILQQYPEITVDDITEAMRYYITYQSTK
jgi:uncharacterized protein (DUF433 family)